MMTSSNGSIFRVTGPLCGEFTGPCAFPAQRPVTRSFDIFFDLRLNKRLSKQSWGWWFETPPWSLWRHCNVQSSFWYNVISEGYWGHLSFLISGLVIWSRSMTPSNVMIFRVLRDLCSRNRCLFHNRNLPCEMTFYYLLMHPCMPMW